MRRFFLAGLLFALAGLAGCQTTGLPEARETRVTTAYVGVEPVRVALDANYCLVPRGRYANDFEGRVWAAFDRTQGNWHKVAFFITCDDYRAIQSSIIQQMAVEGDVSVFMPGGVPSRFDGSRATYIDAIIKTLNQKDIKDEGNSRQKKLESHFADRGSHKSRQVEGEAKVELIGSDQFGAYFHVRYRHVLAGAARDLVQVLGKTVVDGLQVQVSFTTDRSVQAEIRALDTVKRLVYGLFAEEASI